LEIDFIVAWCIIVTSEFWLSQMDYKPAKRILVTGGAGGIGKAVDYFRTLVDA